MKKALAIEYRDTASLKPYEKNARVHTPAQIDKIKALIKRFGWTNPILVDGKQGVVAGHGRLQAAKQLGMEKVPVIELAGLSQADRRAYILADNRVAEDSGWDTKLLAGELTILKDMGSDLELTGFDPTEIDELLAPKDLDPEEPAVPPLQKAAVTKKGDLWRMGEHRILCGDSTNVKHLERLMAGRQAQVVFTDPPYGVSYEARSGNFEQIEGDDKRRAALLKLLTGAFRAALPHTRQDAGWYVWHASSTRELFSTALRDTGLTEIGYLIWVKPAIVLGWSDYRWAHEPCFYASRQGHRPAFHGDRSGSTVWRVTAVRPNGEQCLSIGTGVTLVTKEGAEIHVTPAPPKGKKARHAIIEPGQPIHLEGATAADSVWEARQDKGKDVIHPTQKPCELARRALRNSSLEGDIVLDMFGGSGSTLMAAEQTKRVAYLLELDPLYVDATIRRWQTATGHQALDGKGQPFEG